MAFILPRRLKDLPKLEVESEDENKSTPIKTNNGASIPQDKQNDKENSSCLSNVAMYPKRRSELPPLELDSESEDEQYNQNNLNCAILNDSFLLSPSRSEQDEKLNSREASASKDMLVDATDNMSFVSKFHKMALSSVQKPCSNPESTAKEEPNESMKQMQKGEGLNREAQTQNKCVAVQRVQSEPLTQVGEIETPMKATDSKTNQSLTVATTADSHFVTPQIRSFSVKRRPRELCLGSTSQKSRMAIANEFRSQKVLFQTPITIQRAAIAPNDSLAISLCDTIPECMDVTSSAEKTPLKKSEEPAKHRNSKKSLEATFDKMETNNNAKSRVEENKAVASKEEVTNKNEPKPPKAQATAVSTTASNNKDSVLFINNMEFMIVKKLGAGGSSSVYLAVRKEDNKQCALKVVDLQGDPLIVEGYLNETKLLAKLQGSPCVVALYDYQLLRKESRLFMVMEKGDSDLQKILQIYTTNLPLYVLMNYLYQMIQAVNYIHQNGVIHSDLKPANFLMVNGRLKLIDFGIASNIAIDSTSIIKYSQAGTFNYISPEALTDTSTGSSPMRNQPKIKISTKSDVWSLGCILYLFLYQKTPFSHIKQVYAKMAAISNPSTVIDYPPLCSYYPAMLLHMVKNCLQHNPKKRPSCADLLKYPFNMIIPIQNLSVGNNQT